MSQDVQLVPLKAESFYTPIYEQLDRLPEGGALVVTDPSPGQKMAFRDRLARNLRINRKGVIFRMRSCVDGRVQVTKLEPRP